MKFGLLAGILLALSASANASSCLKVPAPSNIVTSVYGWRYHPVFKRWRLHRGIDLRAPLNTTLIATHAGTIQVTHSAGGGNELRIVGSDGMVTRYLHLTRALVDPGSHVAEGEKVAYSGSTGEASAGPHLHLELYPSGKGDVNPEPYLCGVQRKAGADTVDGFPVKACNPDGDKCSGGGSLGGVGNGATGATSGTGGTSTNGSSTGSSSTGTSSSGSGANPPAPNISAFDDMSVDETVTSEVMRRFANPDWGRELAQESFWPAVREYLHMYALEQYLALQRRASVDRIETLLATRLARANSREMSTRLDAQRNTVSRAASKQ